MDVGGHAQLDRSRRRRSWDVPRFSRANLLFTVLQVTLCFLILPQVDSNKFGVEVARFIDDERLEACNLDLARSDGNDNGELDSEELVGLVGSLSQGRISVEEFNDLPLRLRMIYHWTACSCVFEPDATPQCCVGANSHVNIEEADSSLPFLVNRMFCSELTRGIGKVEDTFPALPTAAPTPPPSPSPTGAPSWLPSTAPTTTHPSNTPSVSSSTPSISPTTTYPSSSPSESPTVEESASPTEKPPPTVSPTTPPTISPTPPPTEVPPETLCITFQYELVNNRSLTAEDVQNEEDNTLKTGLREATRSIVIQLLNETYPRTARAQPVRAKPAQMVPKATATTSHQRHDPNDWKWKSNSHQRHDPNNWKWKSGASSQSARHDPNNWKWKSRTSSATSHDPTDWTWGTGLGGGRRRLTVLRQAASLADEVSLGMDLQTYSIRIHEELSAMYNVTKRKRRYLLPSHDGSYIRKSRRLVYYTDAIPVEIPIVIDNPNCPSNDVNAAESTIRCAIVSSNLCVVLEEGDDAPAIRSTLISGLSDAIDNGEFEDLIPQERLQGDL